MSFLNKARTVLRQVTFISLRFHVLKMEMISTTSQDFWKIKFKKIYKSLSTE